MYTDRPSHFEWAWVCMHGLEFDKQQQHTKRLVDRNHVCTRDERTLIGHLTLNDIFLVHPQHVQSVDTSAIELRKGRSLAGASLFCFVLLCSMEKYMYSTSIHRRLFPIAMYVEVVYVCKVQKAHNNRIESRSYIAKDMVWRYTPK